MNKMKHLDERIIEAMERLEAPVDAGGTGHVVGSLAPARVAHDALELADLALDHLDSRDPSEVEFARERLLEAAALLCEAAGEKFERRKLGPVGPMIWV